ncbi:MAG TPA: ribosome-associated translation inhibitor RaiA [Terriglobales bacterium]|jgi:putative sigma-54 modulation protein|nr:ribosome-associated translation inhibitor RaiA [Terriglobales bacterium]
MNVEYTGRHYEVTPANRKDVEAGLTKIRKILRNKFDTKVILAVEKRRHKAEITLASRVGPLVGLAEAGDMKAAIGEALEHLEKQALRNKTRIITKKRRHNGKNGKWNGEGEPMPTAKAAAASGSGQAPTATMVVHKFPAVAKSTEVHLVRTDEAVALRPMTLEEAIKEAHFRDRDVFVFRDPKGKLMVLHRTRDGRMELIEAP